MMPDDDDAHTQGEERVTAIVARCGNIFTRFTLSPPAALTRDAARHWLGLTPDEVAEVLYEHMDRHRGEYTQGSGDQLFHILQADIRRALEVKHPRPIRKPELDRERPQPRRSRVVKIPTASGVADIFDSAAQENDRASNTERPSSSLNGFEDRGVSIDDDEGGA